MADLIERQAAIEWLKKVGRFWKCCEDAKRMRKTLGGIINHIEKMPAVDAVEVVRCKDCKYYKSNGSGYGECPFFDEVKDDEYCSSGERREENAAD